MKLSLAATQSAVAVPAPFVKGGDKARQRLVGDLLFAPRANPPSPASRTPAPFCKGGNSGQPLVAWIGTMNHGTVS